LQFVHAHQRLYRVFEARQIPNRTLVDFVNLLDPPAATGTPQYPVAALPPRFFEASAIAAPVDGVAMDIMNTTDRGGHLLTQTRQCDWRKRRFKSRPKRWHGPQGLVAGVPGGGLTGGSRS
jgi:hypothetical protein